MAIGDAHEPVPIHRCERAHKSADRLLSRPGWSGRAGRRSSPGFRRIQGSDEITEEKNRRRAEAAEKIACPSPVATARIAPVSYRGE